MKSLRSLFSGGWIALFVGVPSLLSANSKAVGEIALTEEGRRLEAWYSKELEGLRSQLTKRIPYVAAPTTDEARKQQFNFPDIELGATKRAETGRWTNCWMAEKNRLRRERGRRSKRSSRLT